MLIQCQDILKIKKGEKEESKAIVKHELGHILHAILNPTNFRLASTMDAFNQYKSSAPPKIMQEIDKREGEEPGEKEGRWVYAKDSIRENIAEIFTALTSGVSISNEQYDWYLKHGGPRIDGRYSKENDSFEVKKIKNQNDKNKTTKKT